MQGLFIDFLRSAYCAEWLFSLQTAPFCNVQVKLWETLANRSVMDQKLSRKLVHITAGPLLVLTWPLFRSAACTVQLCRPQGHHAIGRTCNSWQGICFSLPLPKLA